MILTSYWKYHLQIPFTISWVVFLFCWFPLLCRNKAEFFNWNLLLLYSSNVRRKFYILFISIYIYYMYFICIYKFIYISFCKKYWKSYNLENINFPLFIVIFTVYNYIWTFHILLLKLDSLLFQKIWISKILTFYFLFSSPLFPPVDKLHSWVAGPLGSFEKQYSELL